MQELVTQGGSEFVQEMTLFVNKTSDEVSIRNHLHNLIQQSLQAHSFKAVLANDTSTAPMAVDAEPSRLEKPAEKLVEHVAVPFAHKAVVAPDLLFAALTRPDEASVTAAELSAMVEIPVTPLLSAAPPAAEALSAAQNFAVSDPAKEPGDLSSTETLKEFPNLYDRKTIPQFLPSVIDISSVTMAPSVKKTEQAFLPLSVSQPQQEILPEVVLPVSMLPEKAPKVTEALIKEAPLLPTTVLAKQAATDHALVKTPLSDAVVHGFRETKDGTEISRPILTELSETALQKVPVSAQKANIDLNSPAPALVDEENVATVLLAEIPIDQPENDGAALSPAFSLCSVAEAAALQETAVENLGTVVIETSYPLPVFEETKAGLYLAQGVEMTMSNATDRQAEKTLTLADNGNITSRADVFASADEECWHIKIMKAHFFNFYNN